MKLSGIRVIDLSVFLPGPYLTQALADHGAEVIKVEAPGEGDPVRHLGLSDGPSTVYFRSLNRGKKSVVLNLKDATDREALLELCDTADVFVESFRPGVVDRLGVGYAQLRARNPRIVYCSISAFGQSGPNRDRPSHDLGVEAESGVLSMTLGRDGQPAIPGIPVADIVSALQGLAGVLMALLRRATSGEGDYLDIAMHDSMVSAIPNILGPTLAENRQPVARHERTTGGSAFYQIYDTSDATPHRAVRAGDEVRAQSARRARPAGACGIVRQGRVPTSSRSRRFCATPSCKKRATSGSLGCRGSMSASARSIRLPEALQRRTSQRARHGADRCPRAPAPRLADPLSLRARAPEPAGTGAGRARRRTTVAPEGPSLALDDPAAV